MQLIMDHNPDEWPTISIFDVPKGTKPEIIERPVIETATAGNFMDIPIGNVSIHLYEETAKPDQDRNSNVHPVFREIVNNIGREGI